MRICRAMFTDASPSMEGQYHSIHRATNSPAPVPGRVPILIGGNGERRTLRLVARYGDACNLTVGNPVEIKRKLDVLDVALLCHGTRPGGDHAHSSRWAGDRCTRRRCRGMGERLRAQIGMDHERFHTYAIVGTPESVCEQVQASLDAGLDGFVFNTLDTRGRRGGEPRH